VDPGDAHVGQPGRLDPVGGERDRALVGDGQVGGAGGADDDPLGARGGRPPAQRGAGAFAPRVALEGGGGLGVVGAGEQHGAVTRGGQQLLDDGSALLRGLPGAVDRLGHALPQRPVVVDPSEPQVGERKAPQAFDGVLGGDGTHLDGVEEAAKSGFVHVTSMLPRR
jgi:hypothetical protein